MNTEKYIPFFKRELAAKGQLPTTFTKDVPSYVRNKIWMAWDDPQLIYSCDDLVTQLKRMFGLFELPNCPISTNRLNRITPIDELFGFFTKEEKANISLTVVELMCITAVNRGRGDFLTEVNTIFQDDAIGYQAQNINGFAKIIPIEDETFVQEVIDPCLSILCQFPDTLDHYLRAYDELKEKNYKDAMTNLGRAMETLLKTRFSQIGITFDPKRATIGPLLTIAQGHASCGNHNFENIKQCILDVSRGRNDHSHGHEQGKQPEIDAVYTRFMINQAAASLLFLAEVSLQPDK